MTRVRKVAVAKVVAETDEARSVVFEVPPGESRWFRAKPGQFLTVRVPLGDGVPRCYSLSGGPDDPPTITVKRAGPASAWLVDELSAGQELELLPPAGRFTPGSPDTDLLLIAAGSGITPVMAILRWVLATGSAHVELVYANRDKDSVIFARQLELLAVRHPGRLSVTHWLETDRGLPTAAALAEVLAPHAGRETFLCGPEAFMAETEAALETVGAGRGRLRIERYESLTDDPFTIARQAVDTPAEPAPAGGSGVTAHVELDGEQHEVPWPQGIPLLEAVEKAGVQAPFSCREGNCGACACQLLEGRVTLRNNETLTQDDLDEGWILACQADPETPVVRVTYD